VCLACADVSLSGEGFSRATSDGKVTVHVVKECACPWGE